MFTQCSNCETVFRLSAEVLRAAGGQVRCGNCGEVFNALARLAEDASSFAVGGESSHDLERRADTILHSRVTDPPPAEDFGAPGAEIAHLQILDSNEPLSDPSMEFTLPPGELDRIFKAAQPRPREAEEFEVDIAPEPIRIKATPPPTPPPPPPPPPPPHPEEVAAAQSAFDVPDAVRFEILSGMESAQPLDDLRPPHTPGVKRWFAAAVLFALLLGAQVVHHNRDYWTTHGPFAALLRDVYTQAGAPVASAANLSAYQLRQWGVSGDPSADGTLRVRASILNTAAQLEPFPLLRVTLANRFGTSIGARDFEPSEYLGKPTARYLNPGEQVDATLDILDPGRSAEGFEIDVCLRGADRKISCANDLTPAQTKR